MKKAIGIVMTPKPYRMVVDKPINIPEITQEELIRIVVGRREDKTYKFQGKSLRAWYEEFKLKGDQK